MTIIVEMHNIIIPRNYNYDYDDTFMRNQSHAITIIVDVIICYP